MKTSADPTIYRTWNRKYWIAAGFALLAVVAAEQQTFFIERALGRYLTWQNAGREKVGRQWQVEKQRLLAGTRLERFSKELRSREKQAAELPDFAALLELSLREKQFIVPVRHFLRLYRMLPPHLQRKIIFPETLITLQIEQNLSTVILNRSDRGMEIFFLGRQSELLHLADLSEALVQIYQRHGREQILDIGSRPEFADRIYSMQTFWHALDGLPERWKQAIMEAMPGLLELAGPNTRIGISNKISEDLVAVAVAPDQLRAILYYLPEEWIIDLLTTMDRLRLRNNENENFL